MVFRNLAGEVEGVVVGVKASVGTGAVAAGFVGCFLLGVAGGLYGFAGKGQEKKGAMYVEIGERRQQKRGLDEDWDAPDEFHAGAKTSAGPGIPLMPIGGNKPARDLKTAYEPFSDPR